MRAGVAYTFDFDIFEDNDITASVNLLRDIDPKFTSGIEGFAKRRRANERTFTVTDTPTATAAPTMTDDLVFTTSVSLSGTPRIVFAPVGTLLRVADASLDVSVARTDKHQVTIGLAVDVAGVDAVRGFLFSAGRGAGGFMIGGQRSRSGRPIPTVYAGQRVTGGGTPSEVLAVIAIDQQKSKEFRLQVRP
jgi:hypothetical protein